MAAVRTDLAGPAPVRQIREVLVKSAADTDRTHKNHTHKDHSNNKETWKNSFHDTFCFIL